MSEASDQRIYDRCIIRVGDLEAENERLRELVRDMLPFVKFSCDEEYCPWYYECDIATCYAYDDARERAGELGIEVDG